MALLLLDNRYPHLNLNDHFVLFEQSAGSGAVELDEANGILRNVLVCGRSSPNCPRMPGKGPQPIHGTKYTDAAFKKAIPLYEGITVRINHEPRDVPPAQRRDRDAWDALGNLRNVRLTPEGLRADLHYDRTHKFAPTLIEEYSRKLRRFGLSHHAAGGGPVKDGWLIVESIPYVRSVDIVDGSATTTSLYESHSPHREGRTVIKFRDLMESVLPKVKGKKRIALVEFLESEYMAEKDPAMVKEEDPPIMGDLPVEEPAAPETADPDEALRMGFETALKALVTSALAGEVDEAAATAKFKDLLKTFAKLTSTAAAPASESKPASDSSETAESKSAATRKLEEELATFKNRDKVVMLAESLNCKTLLTDRMVGNLAQLNEAEWKPFMTDLIAKAKGPRSFSPAPKTPPPAPAQNGGNFLDRVTG